MPKLAMDYSKTFIYKICCKDPAITDVYIGHTTNVVKRRCCHKHRCNNDKDKHYNIYVYQFIRDNGGWDNWDMIVLIELNCKDKNEALRNERKYLEELQATLNKVIPTRTTKEYNEQNKDKKIEYYEQNRYKILEQRKEYREHNKEKIAEANKEYAEQNKEKIAEYQKKYKEQNKDKKREYNQTYREKQRQAKLLNADNV